MVTITGGKLAPFPGGVVVQNSEGKYIGSVGISGATGDEDEYIAITGITESALGVQAFPAEH